MKPEREVIEVNFEELTALLERARQGPLARRGLSAAGRCDPGVEPSDRKDRGEEHDDQPTARAVGEARARRRHARCWSKRGSRPRRKTVRLRTRRARRSRGTVETAPRRMAGLAGSRSRTLPSSRETVVRSARRARFTNRRNPLCASGWWGRRRLRPRSMNWNVSVATCAARFLKRRLRRAWARRSTTRRRLR